MVSGHPSNQGLPGGGQPVVSMGPQMHAGMAGGPGVPQAGQTASMMAGISQGGGVPGVSGPTPSAHALSHLNPAHPQQLYQQQQAMQQASKSLFQHQHSISISRSLVSMGFQTCCYFRLTNHALIHYRRFPPFNACGLLSEKGALTFCHETTKLIKCCYIWVQMRCFVTQNCSHSGLLHIV